MVDTRFLYQKVKFEIKEDMDEEQKTCQICVMEFEDAEIVSYLECMHNFHDNCFKEWLKKKQ
jgi:hypothetical protein